MRRMKKGGSLIWLVCAYLLFPFSASAIGQITEPIEIGNALREKVYEEKVTIINTESSQAIINLSAEGDIAAWTRFFTTSQGTDNITSIEVPAKSSIDIVARFTIPAGKPNGLYGGVIAVAKTAGEFQSPDESGSSVAQRVERSVSIEIKDEEELDFDASIIPEKYDYMQGEPLKIRIIYDNRSNIEVAPQITFKIKQGESTIYSAIFPYPESEMPVAPFSLQEIPPLEIPISNLANGKYEATFRMSQGDKFSLDKDFTFSVGMVKAAADTKTDRGIDPSISIPIAVLAIAAIYILPAWNARRKKQKENG